jgi:hypothetical protein
MTTLRSVPTAHLSLTRDPAETPEQALPGGFVNDVVRIGGTVRRPAPKNAAFVRRLLRYLEDHQWSAAPQFLGEDEQGREMLTFIDGYVAWELEQPPEVRSEDSLVRVAELVRELHDLTAGTDLTAGAEAVCHNDLSPKNTVYRDLGAGLRPVAFIDWDNATPGERVHDVAHMCWQYLALGPTVTDPPEAARMVRVLADAYRLAERSTLVDTILWWQDRCWRGIEAAAAAGEPAGIRLCEAGAARAVRTAQQWTADNRSLFDRALA